jgi:hypothetical protein
MVVSPLRDGWRVSLSTAERERYVRWWIEHSGLSTSALRQIATGIWSDRLLDGHEDRKESGISRLPRGR